MTETQYRLSQAQNGVNQKSRDKQKFVLCCMPTQTRQASKPWATMDGRMTSTAYRKAQTTQKNKGQNIMTVKFLGFKVTVQKEEKIENLKVNINETERKNAVREIDLSGIKAKLQALKNDD